MHAAVVRRQYPPTSVQHAALILMLAWLPTLAYVGHWSALAAPASSHAASHSAGAAPDGAHERHCHVGFDDCSSGGAGADLMAATSEREVLRFASITLLGFALSDELRLLDRADAPVPPPPRR